jgi:hypothetical protein
MAVPWTDVASHQTAAIAVRASQAAIVNALGNHTEIKDACMGVIRSDIGYPQGANIPLYNPAAVGIRVNTLTSLSLRLLYL